jgi:hypothetical protein
VDNESHHKGSRILKVTRRLRAQLTQTAQVVAAAKAVAEARPEHRGEKMLSAFEIV